MPQKILAGFAAPSAAFRGAPFWALNGKLTAGEMRRQIRLMKQAGFGGFFFHSRAGMEIPYLRSRYFKLLDVAIDEAKKLDLSLWLYDEDRWPSGAAGGMVTKDRRFRIRYLACREKFSGDGTPVASFAVRFMPDGTMATYRPVSPDDALRDGEKYLHYYLCVGDDDPWFNGQSYLDTLNPDAVEKFCSVTHDAYFCACGGDFGKCVRGIFTDEPNFNAIPPGKNLPWTEKLPGSFRRKYHYDLRQKLPELCFPLAGNVFSKARLDYRNHLTELFVRAFAEKISRRCRDYHLEMTGHLLGEDFLGKQTRNVGNAMRFYEKMTMPGIDMLTENALFFNTVKQCVSVARQLGKRSRLSELYGCTGWDFSFAGYRALGEWQYALGINFRCLHHAFYTLKGVAKRDYPASIFYQSPWFRDFKSVEDAFARLGAALAPGEEVRDLVVISPLESVFGQTFDTREAPENENLTALTSLLLGSHLDFDFGDEKILAAHGKIRHDTLQIGKAHYRAVLIPPVLTLRSTTLTLLQKFAVSGGKVFYLGEIPRRIDGEISADAKKSFAFFRQISEKDLDAALSPFVRHIHIVDARKKEIFPALYLLKKGKNFETLFVCNTSAGGGQNSDRAPRISDRKLAFPDAVISWQIPESWQIFRLDPDSGNVFAVSAQRRQNQAVFPCPLDALDRALFMATPKKITAVPFPAPQKISRKQFLPDIPVPISLDEPNVLVLDRPVCTANGRPVAGETFLQIDAALREMLGGIPREKDVVQPWCRKKSSACPGTEITLHFEIDCRHIPESACFLALEDPKLYRIFFNGKIIPVADEGYWCDRAIRKIRIDASYFRTGKNELRLVRHYDLAQPGLESFFLLGKFGVFADTLDRFPETLRFGDWTKQGLPYYAGNVTYHLKTPSSAQKIFFPHWQGTALKIKTGNAAPQILVKNVADVQKNSAVYVTVLGSRRNAFGPFYSDDAPFGRRGAPVQFAAFDFPEKSLVPYGISEAPEIGIK